jgi:FkbM family methyltransferase
MRTSVKGKWFFDLVKSMVNKSINVNDGFRYFFARFKKKPIEIIINSVRFSNVDHILWSLVGEIFISTNYCPPGFEIRSTDIVLDIGAHKGVFVAYAATRTKNHILAYEPDKDNFENLLYLIEINNWHNVTPINKAISTRNGNQDFYLSKHNSRSNLIGRDPVIGFTLQDKTTVGTIKLESVLESLHHIDFLKIDCEGAEQAILLNCNEETFNKIRMISAEYHFANDPNKSGELISHLKKFYLNVSLSYSYNTNLCYLYCSGSM